MAFASGGTVLSSVRSWKASFDLLKYCEAGVLVMFVIAFWKGDLVGVRQRLYRFSCVKRTNV